jgi:DNA (cytosine-5)-methyltransferase 3A
MNVLSLFDGMSCGQIALNRIGISPTKYYAAEVDKYAIQVTQVNYPNTIQMGDVTKWREWDIDWSTIDLLIGGSPCQGFSFAGKQLAFDDPRSKLFFVYVDILNHIKSVNSKVLFMLENVKMKKEHLAIISEQLGVEPVFINSALVSAQNRQRYYWCNWYVEQPEDRGILLADILEVDPVNTTFMSEKFKARNAHILRDDLEGKAKSLSAMEYVKNGRQGDYINHTVSMRQKPRGNNPDFEKEVSKSPTISANSWEHNNHVKSMYIHVERGPQFMKNDKAYALTATCAGGGKAMIIKSAARRGRGDEIRSDNKTNALLSDGHQSRWLAKEGAMYRKLTSIECERLQTVPDNYTNHVSNTQRYKMLGNGWTVDVITHIFSAMQSAVVLPIKADQRDMFGGEIT